MMRHFLTITTLALSLSATLIAQEQTIRITEQHIERSDDQLLVDLTFDISELKVSSGQSLRYLPVIQKGDSLQPLLPLIVNGRDRQVLYERTGRTLATDNEYAVRRKNGTTQQVDYHARVPFTNWMNRSELVLTTDLCGCGWNALSSQRESLFPITLEQPVPQPLLAYIAPQAEVKQREKSGSAFLDFPVNRTEIRPDYRQNPLELAKIRETIESVRDDEYATLTAISIKGYASPEGSYANNERLAKGRSEALANYLKANYNLQQVNFQVAYEPEDWTGLERRVEQLDRPDKEATLAIIRDASISDPDQRDNRLKQLNGGSTYSYLLQEIYPALRHSDYTVAYTIRPFSLDEAKKLIYSDPKQLSREEMYQVALSYESGSPEFKEVFEIIVRLYPDDPVSNLNAANSALLSNKPAEARRYLAKCADSPEKQLAEGVAAWLEGDTTQAREIFTRLQDDPTVGTQAKANNEQLSNL